VNVRIALNRTGRRLARRGKAKVTLRTQLVTAAGQRFKATVKRRLR
jgi:hypothetical protein